MTTLIGPRGGPATPVDIDLPIADGLCDFSKLKDVDLSGADLDLGFEKPRSETRVVAAMSGGVDYFTHCDSSGNHDLQLGEADCPVDQRRGADARRRRGAPEGGREGAEGAGRRRSPEGCAKL